MDTDELRDWKQIASELQSEKEVLQEHIELLTDANGKISRQLHELVDLLNKCGDIRDILEGKIQRLKDVQTDIANLIYANRITSDWSSSVLVEKIAAMVNVRKEMP